MLERIADCARASQYDFRRTAFDRDPLRHLFGDWIPYYRLKWAIAKVLQPTSILEVGVRYGYSGMAFLDACPGARYLGIDIDSEVSGGSKGAVFWARRTMCSYRADFVIADSQTMDRFPGGRYDLVHVDGQQDGDSSLHDLELALRQAKYILADGYYWTRENFHAMSEFLYRYRDEVEFFGVIPGYAGELLIKVREISATFTDFGSCEALPRGTGLKLEDPCLLAMAELSAAAPRGRALVLGYGRPELATFLAGEQFGITTADPHQSITGVYQLTVAAGLAAHLAPADLARLYANVAAHLAPDGLFLMHTWPNVWVHRYEYPHRRRAAQSVGAYLPPDPRTRYEQMMHINEQTPQGLRRQLRQHFPHVLVWFGMDRGSDVFDNLRRPYSIGEMRAAGHLYAAAAHSRAALDTLRGLAVMEEVATPAADALRISLCTAPGAVPAESVFPAVVNVYNGTCLDLKSAAPHPVHLSYHWLTATGEYFIFDGRRTRLFPALRAGETRRYEIVVEAPPRPGEYILRCTLVQEMVRWMDPGVCCDAPVEITPDANISFG